MGKISAALAFMLVPVFALADVATPEPVVGDFRFTGEFRIELVQRNEVVSDLTAEGQEKLARLLREGFFCMNKAPHWHSCAKQIPVPDDYSELNAMVAERFDGYALILEKPISGMKLEFNTGFYKQWTVEQKVVAGGSVSYTAKYAWTQGLWKVYLEGATLALLVEGDHLAIQEFFNVGTEFSWDRYFVAVEFF